VDILEQLEDLGKPTVEPKSWMSGVSLRLASAEDLDRIVEECIEAGHYGLDLETTGLDARVFRSDDGTPSTNAKIVGVCIAPSIELGYYIPIRHKDKGNTANVPVRLVRDMIRKICEAKAVAVFHHAKFDQEFLEHDPAGQMGDWSDDALWEDTLILAYLRNTRERRKGLKHLSKVELQREMIELPDLFPADERKKKRFDFSTLDPTWEPVVWYAAADAVNTLALFYILHPQVVEKDEHNRSQKTLYRLEKICLTATRWMERNRIHINRPQVEKLIKLGQQEWFTCLVDVYDEASTILERDVRPDWFKVMAGLGGEAPVDMRFDPQVVSPSYMEVRERALVYAPVPKDNVRIEKSVPSLVNPNQMETVKFGAVYDVTIPANLGLMLREMGVHGLIPTEKSGQVKTDKSTLERVIDEAGSQFPFMGKIKRFREVAKGLSTNLLPVYLDTAPKRSPDGCVWANFNGHKVDTGRFSTPSPRDGPFHGQVRWNVHSTPATYDKSKPECVRRMRECIQARPGHVLFAVDYSGVELRIVTNLSGESKWLEEFFRCSGCNHHFDRSERPPHFCPKCGSDKIGDLHTLTALSVYGDEIKNTKGFKQKRQNSKALNFAMCYGGGGGAAQRAVGVDKDEGWRLKRQFDKTYSGLQRWWKSQHKTAERQTYVTTAFGRKYPLPDIRHEVQGFRAKAQRNSVNGPVQGTSADIMKFAMALLYREFRERGWLDKVLLVLTIHDELVFEIREDVAGEAIPIIEDVMVRRPVQNLKWIIPLKVDIEFGLDWTVPFNLTKMAANKGGGDWDAHWARIFPTQYQSYLAKGGTPVEGADSTAFSPAVAPPKDPVPRSSLPVDVGEGQSGGCVYTLPSYRLTPEVAEKLARVLGRCAGRGKDTLRIITDDGIDLLEQPIQVSFTEFQVIARYEGL